ncbi:Fcf2 pre-rRNA processing family protein [Cryptosporidium felis]|nr:Fcf2 pre-rRNA processing family protein [Cryptosporidium felis]
MKKIEREVEFSGITLPVNLNDIYIRSFEDDKLDTQRPSGVINIGKYGLNYENRMKLPEVKLNTNLVSSIVNVDKTANISRGEQLNSSSWFDIPEKEKTEQIKQELMALQLRGSMGPKSFYKSESINKNLLKFNFGVVVDGSKIKTGISDDSSTYRSNKKRTGSSLVHELLKDSQTQRWANKRYYEIQKVKMKGGKKWYRRQILKRNKY